MQAAPHSNGPQHPRPLKISKQTSRRSCSMDLRIQTCSAALLFFAQLFYLGRQSVRVNFNFCRRSVCGPQNNGPLRGKSVCSDRRQCRCARWMFCIGNTPPQLIPGGTINAARDAYSVSGDVNVRLLLWNIVDVLEDIDCACCRSKRAMEITASPCATSEFQSNHYRVSWPAQRMIDHHIHVRSCQPTSAQLHRQVSGYQACPNAFPDFSRGV